MALDYLTILMVMVYVYLFRRRKKIINKFILEICGNFSKFTIHFDVYPTETTIYVFMTRLYFSVWVNKYRDMKSKKYCKRFTWTGFTCLHQYIL